MSTKSQMDKDAERIKYLFGRINEELRNAEIAKEALMIAEKYRIKAERQREMLNQLNGR